MVTEVAEAGVVEMVVEGVNKRRLDVQISQLMLRFLCTIPRYKWSNIWTMCQYYLRIEVSSGHSFYVLYPYASRMRSKKSKISSQVALECGMMLQVNLVFFVYVSPYSIY